MDPVTLTKLLSVTNAIEECREDSELTITAFQNIIGEQTRSKKLLRRTKEYLRVFRDLGWLISENDKLKITSNYQKFVGVWNIGDLKGISDALLAYQPYAEFLNSLKTRQSVHPPDLESLGTKELVALDTFRSWAIATGQAYISPFDKRLYWGGDWNEKCPHLKTVKDTCQKAYARLHKTSGYVNIGQLADHVCRHLHISFQAFEIKMNLLLDAEPESFILASATSREPSSKHKLISVRPREEVLKERFAEYLRGRASLANHQWLVYRYPEDGILVKSRLVRLLKWSSSHDAN